MHFMLNSKLEMCVVMNFEEKKDNWGEIFLYYLIFLGNNSLLFNPVKKI